MGEAVLIETLKMAAYYVNHSNITIKSRPWRINFSEAKSCYLFVQGTGLNVLLSRFGLNYDAEKIQDNFNYCVRRS